MLYSFIMNGQINRQTNLSIATNPSWSFLLEDENTVDRIKIKLMYQKLIPDNENKTGWRRKSIYPLSTLVSNM